MELDKKEFDPVSKRGNSHKHSKRTIVNAILYVVRGGIQWRLMPNDFPLWQTVYDHFSRWNKRGVWEKPGSTDNLPSPKSGTLYCAQLWHH
jgi:putative transposase